MAIDPVPNRSRPMSPHLIVADGTAALAFYARAFDAEQRMCLREPGGKLAHAELTLHGANLMLAEEYPELGALSPLGLGGTPVSIHLYVADVDAVVAQAVAAGASIVQPLRDEFFGDRVALLRDPFGHRWQLASRIREVSVADMERMMSEGP